MFDSYDVLARVKHGLGPFFYIHRILKTGPFTSSQFFESTLKEAV